MLPRLEECSPDRALQQDLAADAVQEGIGPVLSRLLRQPQRFVNLGQGLFYVLPFGFDLGEHCVKECDPILDSRRRSYRDVLSKLLPVS